MPKIFAKFERMAEAKAAVDKLRSMGFKGAYMDMSDKMLDEYSEELNPPGTEIGTSLSALVMNSTGVPHDASIAPLLAASPMVSGIGTFREIADQNSQLCVIAEEEKIEEIKQILRLLGGKI